MKTLLWNRTTMKKVLWVSTGVFVLDMLLIIVGVGHQVGVYLFLPSIAGLFVSLVFYKQDAVWRFLDHKVDPGLLPITRIIYAIISLVTAVQHLMLVPSGLEPMNFYFLGLSSPSWLAYVLSIIYILGLVAILFGKWVRLAWIIVFISGTIVVPLSLEIFFKNIIAFYAMFIPPALWLGKHSNKEGKNESWAIMAMALSLAILVTCAGIFKLIDPVWNNGMGFYYSMNIPYFMPKHLWWTLEHKWIMVLFNWLTIIVESLALPLFIFGRTRFAGLLAIAGLGFFLAYPMFGIGLVGGPVVLALVPLLLAITPQGHRLAAWLRIKLPMFFKPAMISNNRDRLSWMGLKWIAIVVFWGTVTGYVYQGMKRVDRLSTWPPRYGDFQVNREPWLKIADPLQNRLNVTIGLLNYTRPPELMEYAWLLELFDYHHLFDRSIFQVELKDSDGNIEIPVHFFNEDGSHHEEYPLQMNERFVLTCWRIMTAYVQGDEDKVRNGEGSRLYYEMEKLARYCASFSDMEAVSATIRLKVLEQPTSFQGGYKPWTNEEWIDFFEYSFVNDESKVLTYGKRYDFSKLEIDVFKNGVITAPE